MANFENYSINNSNKVIYTINGKNYQVSSIGSNLKNIFQSNTEEYSDAVSSTTLNIKMENDVPSSTGGK